MKVMTVISEVLVIGSNLPIIAAPGDDVILPCHLEPMFDVQGLTVEWSKPDMKPDPSDRLSRVEYVHLYRDRQEVPDMKMASYFRRTELFMDDMKHGNISLNVSEEDNGRYRCFIPKLQSKVKAAVVELVLVIGSNLPIIAAPGDDVILPCHLEPMFDVQGLTVEWSKPDLKPDPSDEYVHLYRHGKEVPDMKMASYFRRTELFMDDMKHGNISLKILNVSEEDNGRYRCFIPKLQSTVKAAVVELVVSQKICFVDVCGSKLKFLLTIYDSYVFLCLLDPNYGKISSPETPLEFISGNGY
uniref:Ig-like domain-containing protein n=1 Tax=Neolamprologus brichardi TaxID=32507 RepID=A0A3Q4G6Q5_NEOBR